MKTPAPAAAGSVGPPSSPLVREAVLRIRATSILANFSEADLELVIAGLVAIPLKAGAKVHRGANPSEVFLLADGEIGRYLPGSYGNRVDTVFPGSALELEAFFQARSAWRYDWLAETDSLLLKMDFALLGRILEGTPLLRSYLEKVVCFSELRKFKNDLTLFGLPEHFLLPTFEVLRRLTAQEFEQSWLEERGFMIVHRGEISVLPSGSQSHEAVRTVRRGDYLIWDPSHEDLEILGSEGAEIWWMPFQQWARAVRSTKISFFFKMLEPFEPKPPAEKAPAPPVQDPLAGTEEDEDEDLDPSDFLESGWRLGRLWERRPRILLQYDQMDCGAACLASIAQFHGRKISIPVFREMLKINREGASLFAMKKACEKVGMKAIGLKPDYAQLMSLRAPFIALSQYHFLVVFRVGGRHVLVGDPAIGVQRLSKDEFVRRWSGFVLAVRPTEALKLHPESTTSFWKYLAVFRPYFLPLAEIGLLTILGSLFGLVSPVFTQIVLDVVIPGQKANLLHVVSLAMIAIGVGSALTDWIREYLVAHVTTRVDGHFTALFVRHVFRLPLAFFSARRVGDITSKLLDLASIRQAFMGQSIQMVVGALSGGMYLLFIGLYSWKLALPSAVFAGLLALLLSRMSRKLWLVQMQLSNCVSKDQSTIYEHFNALDTLKSLNSLVSARWRWQENRARMLAAQKREQVINSVVSSVTSGLQETVVISSLLLAAYLYLAKELSLGQVVAVSSFVSAMLAPVLGLTEQWSELSQVTVSLGKVDSVITSRPETTAAGAATAPRLRGEIVFQDVRFGYGDGASEDVLKGVSFSVKPGETVAFVGRSGSGKSTLAYLINLLFAPRAGTISIGGVDISKVALDSLRAQIAMAIQENNVFSGTILENIAVGDRNSSLDRVIAAAKMADAYDFISRLPDGFSTVLGEGGVGLSGGQKQKINIARALYREPAILILDEATSALDAISEDSILHNLKNRPNSPTTIVIAHRLNTVLNADRIAVLDNGTIVESGTHQELMETHGHYYALFKDQIAL